MTMFWVAFGITLALVLGTIWTGRKGRRRAHFVLAPAAVVMLAVTIVLTERLMRAVEFPAREMGIHLVFAKAGALLVLPVILTGLLTVRRHGWRRVHRASVAVFFVVVVIATGTGVWVFSLSTPR